MMTIITIIGILGFIFNLFAFVFTGTQVIAIVAFRTIKELVKTLIEIFKM